MRDSLDIFEKVFFCYEVVFFRFFRFSFSRERGFVGEVRRFRAVCFCVSLIVVCFFFAFNYDDNSRSDVVISVF